MSRLTDLLRQLRSADPQLGADLEKEITELTKRRSFGLVFERHQPEAVELPGQPVRRGSKVRVLPPRGETARGNSRLWRVESFTTDESGAQLAQLVENVTDAPERRTALLDDLVVVAEFDDKIFPGLVETGRVERGGDKPFHTVINAENYHALEMLTYTHRGKVDAIYIDPPYNTGARDWKYNNDYVEGDDDYRHSKWLAFMERRLLVARELLNPDDSVLVVTIDEKEYLRLGMLLEQTFPEAKTQMISSVINPGGSVRQGAFSRTDEYIFVLRIGESRVLPLPLPSDWRGGKSVNTAPVAWRSLLRGGAAGRREDRPNMFYPLFVRNDGSGIHSVGDPIPADADPDDVIPPKDTFAVWPKNPNGQDGRWRTSAATTKTNIEDGFVRANYKGGSASISYLAEGFAKSVRNGEIETNGRDINGVVILGDLGVAEIIPGTAWNLTSHNARDHGSVLVRNLLGGRPFPFPKS